MVFCKSAYCSSYLADKTWSIERMLDINISDFVCGKKVYMCTFVLQAVQSLILNWTPCIQIHRHLGNIVNTFLSYWNTIIYLNAAKIKVKLNKKNAMKFDGSFLCMLHPDGKLLLRNIADILIRLALNMNQH